MCDYSPAKCRNKGCDEVLNLKDVDAHMRVCDYRPVGICEKGCGLLLVHKELTLNNHCCLEALKVYNSELQAKVIDLNKELKKRSLKSTKQQKSLVAQLSAVHNELQMTALRYQRHFTEYSARIAFLTKSLSQPCKGGGTKSLTVVLHRESGSLGFNIIGGRPCEATQLTEHRLEERHIPLDGSLQMPGEPDNEGVPPDEGILVSKIVADGPADKEGGLQVHDRILEVNGTDVSRASHEQAAEAFRAAGEPVVVRVQRVVSQACSTGSSAWRVDTGTQTDITFQHALTLPNSAPAQGMATVGLSLCREDSHHKNPYMDPSDFLEGIHQEFEREELEYEEVDLFREESQEKLGLTLCYRTDDEDETGIYVTEIDPNSIAAQDGRIQEGDRIMQINGVEVQNQEEAVVMLTSERNRAVCLLVARPETQLENGWTEGDRNDFLDDLYLDILDTQFPGNLLQQKKQEDDAGTTDTSASTSHRLEKDSGVGRTDVSSELEIGGDNGTTTSCSLGSSRRLDDSGGRLDDSGGWRLVDSSNLQLSNESVISADCTNADLLNVPDNRCQHFRELLEFQCRVGVPHSEDSECHPGRPVEMDPELKVLDVALQRVGLECLGHLPPAPTTAEERQQLPERSDKDSSSAYHTGESCRSTPLTRDLSPDCSLLRGEAARDRASTQLSSMQKSGSGRGTHPGQPRGAEHEEPGEQWPLPPRRSSHGHAHIPAHAQHYRSYMQLIQQKSAVEFAQSQTSLASAGPGAEWKARARNDGGCHLARRPVRDRLLRERALRITRERCGGGLTTDDDAASEVKVGRYWSREQRKEHAARARERREAARQGCKDDLQEPGGRELSLLQLSHKKMMKKRSKKIFDNWMTIQELLAHGAKLADGTGVSNSLLSVTTV